MSCGSRRWPTASWAPLAELVGKLLREERYHRMHAGTWLERLARSEGEPRERLLAALAELPRDAATVFTPLDGEAALVDAGILAAPMTELEARWRASIAPTFAALDLPMPPAAPRTRSAAGATTASRSDGCGASSRASVAPTPERPGERGRHADRDRAGPGRRDRRAVASDRPRRRVDEAAVRAALAEVMDPELPMLSVVDLGIVHRVEVDPADGPIRVWILPTFVGCPALELIKASIADRLATFGRPVEVTATFEVPWTSDRISPAGRAALAAAGIAPPAPGADGSIGAPALIDLEPRVPCPHCGSRRTVVENLFGPTQCRTIRYCADCRQPFESIKTV